MSLGLKLLPAGPPSEGQEHALQAKISQIPWFSPYNALRAISKFSPCYFVSKQQVRKAQRAANKRLINFPFHLWTPGFHCRLPAQALLSPWEHTGPWSFSSPWMATVAALGNLWRNPPELYRDLVTLPETRKDCRGEFTHIKTRETTLIWMLEVFQGYHMPLD